MAVAAVAAPIAPKEDKMSLKDEGSRAAEQRDERRELGRLDVVESGVDTELGDDLGQEGEQRRRDAEALAAYPALRPWGPEAGAAGARANWLPIRSQSPTWVSQSPLPSTGRW